MKLEEIVQSVKKAFACTLFAFVGGYIGSGCGIDNGGNEEDTTGPNVACTLQDSYEGIQNVDADVTDESGVQEVNLRYRKRGTSDLWTDEPMTNTSGDKWEVPIDFPPDEIEYKVIARDNLGNETEITGTVKKYANEANGDSELADRLEQYKQNGDIIDYTVNQPLDLGGTLVNCDYWVLFEDPTLSPPNDIRFAVGWYQGESDGDHAAEKTECDSYNVPWAQINACPIDEIPAKLDEIRDNGFQNTGQIKAYNPVGNEKEFF